MRGHIVRIDWPVDLDNGHLVTSLHQVCREQMSSARLHAVLPQLPPIKLSKWTTKILRRNISSLENLEMFRLNEVSKVQARGKLTPWPLSFCFYF